MAFATILVTITAAISAMTDYVELEHSHFQDTSNDTGSVQPLQTKTWYEDDICWGSNHEGPWCAFLNPIRDNHPQWDVYNPDPTIVMTFSYQTIIQSHHLIIAYAPYHTSDPTWRRDFTGKVYNGLPGGF
jgi:hypothetical protein